MTHNHRSIIVAVSLILAILACNGVPTANAPQESAPEIQTAAAQTLQVILTPSVTATVQQSIIADTPSLTGLPTGTITPTYSVPMLIVREQTNCRTGPGQDYEVIFTYLSGKKLEIAGRYDPDNYWLVKSDESPTGTCWLWGEYVEVTGSYWVVSSVTPPPTSTRPPPEAPSIQKWDFFCSSVTDEMTITIIWTDRATNETGFRVFRDGGLVAQLPADSTAYTETIPLLTGQSAEYRIEVFNSTGSESSSAFKLTC